VTVAVRRLHARFAGESSARKTLRLRTIAACEERLRRPLSLAEQRVDLLALDEALKYGKSRLYIEIEHEKRRAIEDYVASGVIPSMRYTAQMDDLLSALFAFGQKQAAEELRAMGVPVRAAYAVNESAKIDQARRRLLALFGKMELRIADETHAAMDADMVGAALIDAVERAVPGALDAAGSVISTALYGGFGNVFDDHADLIARWEYSAVMDGATCDACAELDGSTYDSWDAIQEVLPDGGPNPECYGEGRCRCRAVPAEAT
jgi:hypothetical protein